MALRKIILNSLFAACLWFVNPVAFSSEFLEPENGQFASKHLAGYYAMIVDTFSEAYAKDVLARVIVLPSFFPEYAIAIRKSVRDYNVTMVTPELQLWGYQSLADMKNESVTVWKDGAFVRDTEGIARLEARYPEDYRDVSLKRCTKVLDAELGESLIALWEAMLFETRYQHKIEVVVDGVIFHYSMKPGFQTLAGQTHGPAPESKPGRLVAITRSLRDHCEGNTVDLDTVKRMTNDLLSTFQ